MNVTLTQSGNLTGGVSSAGTLHGAVSKSETLQGTLHTQGELKATVTPQQSLKGSVTPGKTLNGKLSTSSYTVDAELSEDSINPVQNKVVTAALDAKIEKINIAKNTDIDKLFS